MLLVLPVRPGRQAVLGTEIHPCLLPPAWVRQAAGSVSLTAGSLATGYGGLDGAVTAAFGAEVIWVADNDPDVCRILDARFPDIRNLGDIREVDWEAVPQVDILTAGFPYDPARSSPLLVAGRACSRVTGRGCG